jgi:hypothetical protein
VAQAMLGDIGVEIQGKIRRELNYMPRGNAALTRSQNTSISGVFVFDCINGNHWFFRNPFSRKSVPHNYFPEVNQIDLSRNTSEKDLLQLSNIMFWPYDA